MGQLNLITISRVCLTKKNFIHVETAVAIIVSVRTVAAINLQFNFKFSNKLNDKTIFRFNN